MRLLPWLSLLLLSRVASALEAPALIATLAHTPPATTAFTEVAFVSLLDQPLQTRGELTWRGASQLEKRIDTPYRETTTIDGEQVTVARERKGTRQFDLQRAPELRGFLASFSALLAGDATQLQVFHTLQVSGDNDAWRLTLTPRDAALAKRVRQITIYGHSKELRCFAVQQADGDSSVLLLEQLGHAKLPGSLTLPHLLALCDATAP